MMMFKISKVQVTAFIPIMITAFIKFKVCDAASACTTCTGEMDSTISKLCRADQDVHINGRCCYLNSVVIGADLHGCNKSESDIVSILRDLPSLKYLALEDNPLTSFTADDVEDEAQLVYLSLPSQLQCPGSSAIWNATLDEPGKTVCQGLLNPCDYNNVTCPHNSHSNQDGLISTECLCDEGYHGYKCLKKGDFPLIPYILGLSIPSAVLCVILWFTQRRYVVKKQK